MSWLKGLFGGKSDRSQSVVPLTDREYEQLFLQVLQGVAANWDEQRLLKLLGDRCGDRQMVVWLRGYGDRLLSEAANPELAGLLVRLGEIGCGELGAVTQGIGVEMRNGNVQFESIELQEGIDEQKYEVEILYKKGLAELEAGRYEESLDFFDRAINIKPDDITWYKKGNSLKNLGRHEDAIESYNRAISINPDNNFAWNNKGICLGDLGKNEESLESYDQAISINPNDDCAWNNKASSLYTLGRYEESIMSADRAIGINPNDDCAWINKGSSLTELGRYEEAISSLDQAISINISSYTGLAWLHKGKNLYYLKRYEDAIISFDHVISINPNDDSGWNGKGVSLHALGRYEEAIMSFDHAISVNSINPNCVADVLSNKGVSLYELGRYTEAIMSYDRAIGIDNNNVSAWNNKGSSLFELRKYEESIKCSDRAISINPNFANAWINKGSSLYVLGRYEEAIISHEKAIAITQGKSRAAWVGRGNAAELISYTEGKKILLRVLAQSLPPNMQNPTLDQRGYYGGISSYNEGFKYINKASEPEDWGQLHHAIGNAYYFHGRKQQNPFSFWHQAIPSYETALETLTATTQFEIAHLETLRDYIRVLLALRETQKALGLLRKGTDFLEARLKEKSGGNRKIFEWKFRGYFNELTVGLYIQQGNLTEALEIAEKDKNAFLRDGLLADTTEPSPDYSQMCAFLKKKPNTAIIYWHLSDNALTTFILAPNASSEITLNLLPTPTTENATLTQRNQLTDWMTAWQNDYADYGGKKTKSESQETKPQPKSENHPWRVQMEERLSTLKTILRITDIETALADSPHCTQLLLIPHRDLHLYPLDSLFDSKYTIAYLPSIQVGIKLLNQPKPNYKRLLSIENPDSSITLEDGTRQNLPKLTAAEAESELICRVYGESTRRAKAETTLAEVTAQLTESTPQPHTIFHFTGHGYYDFFSPINSALALSGGDRLTLKAISNLDLSSYQLACLCACETAIAGNQTITKEYIGIISAFMYSGVANVVSTLWTVESISSALLMIELHRRYIAGAGVDVALAAAKRWLRNVTYQDLSDWYQQEINNLPPKHSLIALLRRYRNNLSTMESQPYNHPYYWAAFTLTGL